MPELNARNTEAFRQGLAAANVRIGQQHDRITSLETTVATLLGRLDAVEREYRARLITAIGRGPTVKPC